MCNRDSLAEEIALKVVSLLGLKTPVRQEWFSIKEAAAYTGLSPKHIRRACKEQGLAYSNVGGQKRPTYRISRQAIDDWMRKHEVMASHQEKTRAGLQKYFPRLSS